MDQRSIEKHLRRWRRRNKAEPEPAEPKTPQGHVHSPTTGGGLPVEDQIRKQWGPRNGGLPVFLCVVSGD